MSPTSVKGGTACLTTPGENDLSPDSYGRTGRARSQSLDSGAPLVPPPLSSALLREELSSGICNCNCGGSCGIETVPSHESCLSQQVAGTKKCEKEKHASCSPSSTCQQPLSSVPFVPFLPGESITKPFLGTDQTQNQPLSRNLGVSLVHVAPPAATNSRKMQRNHYHSRKYE